MIATTALDRPPTSVRLVDAIARRIGSARSRSDGPTRRSFLVRAAIVATALATNPVRLLLRPGTAYAQTSGCGGGNGCGTGWTVFCVTVSGNRGKNTCPGGSYPAGWWKADNSAFCKGAARYYIDCNRLPSQPGSCSCVSCYRQPDSCDARRYCCNNFRYGQCHQEIGGITPVVCRVISCTPPWQWDPTCTTSSRTDNATGSHSAPELAPIGASDITIKYQDLGLLGSRLGTSAGDEGDMDGGGRRRDFQGGSIVFRAAEGAHELKTEIRDAWLGTFGGPAVLGFPTSDSQPYGGGARNEFAVGATIAWTGFTGAHLVYGAIRAKWQELGGVVSPLGYPLADEEATPGGGRQSRFVNGTVTWRPDLAAHAVAGPIHTRWAALGGAGGPLGYPVTDELSTGDSRGRVSWFEAGAIFSTPTTGAHDVRNPPLSIWYGQGGPGGAFGYPTADHATLPGGGTESRFERATLVLRADGVRLVVRGGINAKFVQLGGSTGRLGLPLTNEQAVGDRRGQVTWFEAGAIFWTATTAAHEVRSPILTEWFNRGGPSGSLGYPVSDTDDNGVGTLTVRFERGSISYNTILGTFS